MLAVSLFLHAALSQRSAEALHRSVLVHIALVAHCRVLVRLLRRLGLLCLALAARATAHVRELLCQPVSHSSPQLSILDVARNYTIIRHYQVHSVSSCTQMYIILKHLLTLFILTSTFAVNQSLLFTFLLRNYLLLLFYFVYVFI